MSAEFSPYSTANPRLPDMLQAGAVRSCDLCRPRECAFRIFSGLSEDAVQGMAPRPAEFGSLREIQISGGEIFTFRTSSWFLKGSGAHFITQSITKRLGT